MRSSDIPPSLHSPIKDMKCVSPRSILNGEGKSRKGPRAYLRRGASEMGESARAPIKNPKTGVPLFKASKVQMGKIRHLRKGRGGGSSETVGDGSKGGTVSPRVATVRKRR